MSAESQSQLLLKYDELSNRQLSAARLNDDLRDLTTTEFAYLGDNSAKTRVDDLR